MKMEINDIQYELLDYIVRETRSREIKRSFLALLTSLELSPIPKNIRDSSAFRIITRLIKDLSEELPRNIEKDDQHYLLEKLGYNNG